MYKVKSKYTKSTREFELVFERYPSVKSRSHLILLRTRYRKLDDDFFISKNDKNYKQYIFNVEYAKKELKRLGSLTCCFCGTPNLIIAEKRKITPTRTASVDHFLPKKFDFVDPFNSDNFVIVCEKCNNKKKDKVWDISTLKYVDEFTYKKIEKFIKTNI
jgi:5-methylcytosine-specific restriction endonuclease McrA